MSGIGNNNGIVVEGLKSSSSTVPVNNLKSENLNPVKNETVDLSNIGATKTVKGKVPADTVKVGETTAKTGVTLEKEVVKTLTKEFAVSSTKKIAGAGLIGVPLDMAINSFDYHNGKTDAKTYTAKSLNGFFAWSAFEVGMITTTTVAAKISGKELSQLGKTSLGVGIGLIACSLYNKTVGKDVESGLKNIIPESIAKPFAQKVDRYFAAPVDSYILKPIQEHPKTAIVIGGAIATALTIKFPVSFGKNFLLGFGASSLIGGGGSIVLEKIFPDKDKNTETVKLKPEQVSQPKIKPEKVALPSVETPVTKDEINFALDLEKRFNSPEKEKIIPQEVEKYNNISDRLELMKKKAKI